MLRGREGAGQAQRGVGQGLGVVYGDGAVVELGLEVRHAGVAVGAELGELGLVAGFGLVQLRVQAVVLLHCVSQQLQELQAIQLAEVWGGSGLGRSGLGRGGLPSLRSRGGRRRGIGACRRSGLGRAHRFCGGRGLAI